VDSISHFTHGPFILSAQNTKQTDGGLLDATANQQERALVNTVLALAGQSTPSCLRSQRPDTQPPHHIRLPPPLPLAHLLTHPGSCVATFLCSKRLRGHFSMVDVQNATLAGGVAVGSTCNMMIHPGCVACPPGGPM
jgi:hypothetical protein